MLMSGKVLSCELNKRRNILIKEDGKLLSFKECNDRMLKVFQLVINS